MQNQLPLFLSYEQVRGLPIIQKYEKIFAELDLTSMNEFNLGVGADGTSQHALSVLLLFDLWRALIRFLLSFVFFKQTLLLSTCVVWYHDEPSPNSFSKVF